MCCFTGAVSHVSNTSIFARVGKKGHQVLVYGMTMEADEAVAMVLPIPVKRGRGEKAVQFLNFEKYSDFFGDLQRAFPPPSVFAWSSVDGAYSRAALELEVHSVGSFEASYVPSIADFDRLDPRFRLPDSAWEKLPEYKAFGFAVFKLKPGRNEVHPMAFAFPAGDPNKIFFPTLHIHDGEVHAKEEFDHALYCQTDSAEVKMTWEESVGDARGAMDLEKSHGVLLGAEHVYRRKIRGLQENDDVVVAAV